MTDVDALFSGSYATARDRVLAAAREAGGQVTTYVNPCGRGPDGEELCTDAVWIGPESAERVLFLVSGTHGIEGFGGSACQLGFLRHGLVGERPEGSAVLLVHALNPYGFAHQRRVNEDNVDLNRNFVDHADPPHNDNYEELHAALVPPSWEGAQRKEADRFIGGLLTTRGGAWVQEAVTRGQYRHSDGLFYGGTEPVWSNRLLRKISSDYLAHARHVAYIDLHTGLGAFGEGEPIFRGGRDAGAQERARAWYGDALTCSEEGTSSSTPIIGNTATLVAAVLGDQALLTAITLEFGTRSGGTVLTALRADNWLHLHGAGASTTATTASTTAGAGAGGAPEPEARLFREIKAQIRDAFYPDEARWREMVWTRAQEVFRQAHTGLAR